MNTIHTFIQTNPVEALGLMLLGIILLASAVASRA